MAQQKLTPLGARLQELAKARTEALAQCALVNPSNPLAVAQKIKAMHQLLKDARAWLMLDEHVTANSLAGKIDEVLTAIEKGE